MKRVLTKDELTWWARWCVSTCLGFGASVPTAYKVAVLFVEAIAE